MAKIVITVDKYTKMAHMDCSDTDDLTDGEITSVLSEAYLHVAGDVVRKHGKNCTNPHCHVVKIHTEIIAAMNSIANLHKLSHL